MPTTPTPSNDVFGVYDSPLDGEIYQVSRTGIVLYCKDGPAQVLSFVNGSMCINPLGDFICAVNFDEYALDVFDHFKYRLAKPGEPGLAYFDPATNTYTTDEPQWHQDQFAVHKGLA